MRPLLALILPLGLPLLVISSSAEPYALITGISNQADESRSLIVYIPAQLAYEYLLSIPFRSDLTNEFLHEISKHIQ